MNALHRLLTFTRIEWLMICLSSGSVILDIVTALCFKDGDLIAYPLLVLSVFLTALCQGVWIKCIRGIVK